MSALTVIHNKQNHFLHCLSAFQMAYGPKIDIFVELTKVNAIHILSFMKQISSCPDFVISLRIPRATKVSEVADAEHLLQMRHAEIRRTQQRKAVGTTIGIVEHSKSLS